METTTITPYGFDSKLTATANQRLFQGFINGELVMQSINQLNTNQWKTTNFRTNAVWEFSNLRQVNDYWTDFMVDQLTDQAEQIREVFELNELALDYDK